MPAGIVAYVGRELCRALDYMHRFADADGTPLGLVHRDVTPSNIILTPAAAVKLLDFGIAKFAKATQATQNGVVKGKSGYLSPEQLRGEAAIDGRVDLFAPGAVLHELLTGERLFAGDTDLGTMKKILEMKIPLPSCLRAEVPPALDRAVMRALERIPAKRYGSAWEMARDLDAVVLAMGLREGAVAAFVREVEAAPARLPLAAGARLAHGSDPTVRGDLPTRRDLLMPVRL